MKDLVVKTNSKAKTCTMTTLGTTIISKEYKKYLDIKKAFFLKQYRKAACS